MALTNNDLLVLLLFQEKQVLSAQVLSDLPCDLPPEITKLLHKFEDLFDENKQFQQLPPNRGIEHQIDFIPGSVIPNKPAYRANPVETKEL